jgi:O-antigen ligase
VGLLQSRALSFGLAFMLASSGLALALGAATRSGLVNNAVAASGPLALVSAVLFCARERKLRRCSGEIAMALLWICAAAFTASGSAVLGGSLDDATKAACIAKTCGVFLVLGSIAMCVPKLTANEFAAGLRWFACIEIVAMGAAKFSGLGMNENAYGARLAVAGVVLYAVSARRIVKVAGFLIAVGGPYLMHCRTAAVGAVLAIATVYAEAWTRNSRRLAVVAGIFCVAALFVFADDLAIAVKRLALANLGSQNRVANFFLDDKDARKIEGDFFDREDIWMSRMQAIKANPWIGRGIGTEAALFGLRAHNSYMSVLLEGGLLLLCAWLLFYGRLAFAMSSAVWSKYCDSCFGRLQVVLMAYLATTGFMESSGFGSVATGSNVALISVGVWSAAHFRCATTAQALG